MNSGSRGIFGRRFFAVTRHWHLALGALVCAQAITSPCLSAQATGGVVFGTVQQASSGAALPLATITIGTQTVRADAVGRFRLSDVPAGPTQLIATHPGFARRVITVDVVSGDSVRVFVRLSARGVELERIVVTATETSRSREGGSVSLIGRDAIEHVQASSLADVLQLLPGQPALNPTLSSARQVLLRQAPTGSSRDPGPGTEAERSNALGTSIVLDGVPLSNNANLQTTLTILNSGPNGLPQFSSTAGRGLDLRQLPADNIESVEVIRGVPSARHGDLTAGAVLVTSRAGAQDPELRVRGNPLTLEASTVAGWGRRGTGGLSVDANLVRSQDDPRSTLDRFTRATTQLSYSARLTPQLSVTVRARGYAVLDETKRDPDDRRSQRTTTARDRGGRLDFRVAHGDAARGGWLTELTTSVNIAEQTARYQELITRDIFPLTGARRDTIAPGVYGRSEYLTRLTVDGRPINGYARLESRTDWSRGKWRHQPMVGVELRYDDNLGSGRVFDPIEPPRQNFGVGDRPNDFSTIPPQTQLGPYAEHRLRTTLFGRPIDVAAGARLDLVDPIGSGRSSRSQRVAPRSNVVWQVHRSVAVRGGYGITNKAPTLSQLYPLPRYFDLTSFNYFPGTPAERLVVFTTRVIDPRTAGLGPASTRKMEGAIDFVVRQATGSVTWFDERTTGAFGTTRVPVGMLVPQYRAASFPPGAPPILDPVPIRIDSLVVLFDTPRNSRGIATRGVEITGNSPEWRALRTQLSVSGGWFRTVATDSDDEIPVEQFLSGTVQPTRVGVYPGGRGSESVRAITSLRLVHREPGIGLVASVLWQTSWQEDDRPVGRLDGFPTGFVDRSGTITALSQDEARLPQNASLRRSVLPLEGRWERRPPLHLINLRLTKTLPRRTQMTVFANNAFADRPLYLRQRQPGFERRNPPLFFGVEFLSSLALSSPVSRSQ